MKEQDPPFTGIRLKPGAPPADQLKIRYSLIMESVPSSENYVLRDIEGDELEKPSVPTIEEMASLDWAWQQEGCQDLIEVMAASDESTMTVEIVDGNGTVWSEEFDLKPYMSKEMNDRDLLAAIKKGLEA